MPRLLVVLVALALGACGGESDPGPMSGCLAGDSGRVTVVAEDLAWDADCIEAFADVPLRITVENRDDGVNHNLHLPGAPGSPATELEAGPITQELEVTLPAGEYDYVCDIHPNMVGRLLLVDANPG